MQPWRRVAAYLSAMPREVHKMKIWRLEEKETGKGPYAEFTSREDCPSNWFRYSDRRPLHDMYYSYKDHRFGFPSYKAMLQWFDREDLEFLKSKGFCLVLYEAKEVIPDSRMKQVVFYPETARPLMYTRIPIHGGE